MNNNRCKIRLLNQLNSELMNQLYNQSWLIYNHPWPKKEGTRLIHSENRLWSIIWNRIDELLMEQLREQLREEYNE
jgi:hypothetical protein